MGPLRTKNSTRSVEPSPKPRHKPTPKPAAMKKRLEARKPVAGLGTAAVDALRQERDAGDAPTLQDVGTEVRRIANQLKRVESYITVCRLALDGQNAEQDNEVAKLLRRDVGDLLFKQIRAWRTWRPNAMADCLRIGRTMTSLKTMIRRARNEH